MRTRRVLPVCAWTALLWSGSPLRWLTLAGAFAATLAIEAPIVAHMSASAGAVPRRAARVAILTHLVTWPATMLLIYGCVIVVWVALTATGARG